MDAGSGTARWIGCSRVAFALLGLMALLWIPLREPGASGDFSIGNYLSYFTIQSAALGVVVLLVGGLRDPRGARWQLVRGAATLYLTITGVVYAVLLADVDVMLTERWINDILHRILPLVLATDWVVAPVALAVTGRVIGGWLLHPALYAVYTLVRGPLADWYPYPFLDPRTQGYISLTMGLIVLAGVIALLAVAVLALGGLAAHHRAPAPAS
ncbi:Pr6Pr family membrane protein [Nocardia farcinica]|uniref:Pr6Pr family membrane protein n=1 Tax=Nocardia farcinica TaxID=37329 RepID=UPI0024588CB7|nr:Pr6Pr family membrane protein [Nocardia farcinica]